MNEAERLQLVSELREQFLAVGEMQTTLWNALKTLDKKPKLRLIQGGKSKARI